MELLYTLNTHQCNIRSTPDSAQLSKIFGQEETETGRKKGSNGHVTVYCKPVSFHTAAS